MYGWTEEQMNKEHVNKEQVNEEMKDKTRESEIKNPESEILLYSQKINRKYNNGIRRNITNLLAAVS